MNPEIKAQWVAALRSGEYTQTCGHLHDNEGFCCLGVLTDLYIKAHPGKRWVPHAYSDGVFIAFNDFQFLSDDIIKWAGITPHPDHHGNVVADLDEDAEEVLGDNHHIFASSVYPLTSLNDELGMDFKQIADIIEDYL